MLRVAQCNYSSTVTMTLSNVLDSLTYLFVSQDPLSWSTTTYGYYTGVTHVIKGLCLLVVLPTFKKLNVPYPIIMIISLVSSILGHTVFALSLYTWMAFLCEYQLLQRVRSTAGLITFI